MTVSASAGYLCLFIHAHLPYAALISANAAYHDEWLCASLFESYLPLLELFDRLSKEGIPYRVNLGISPTILEMISDPSIAERFDRYLDKRLELCQKELAFAYDADSPQLLELARYFAAITQQRIKSFRENYRGKVIASLNRLVKCGHLELLAASATGAYLPLLGPAPDMTQAQIKVGVQSYAQYFSVAPRGFWSFAGGYTPEMDEQIIKAGLRYTLVRSVSVIGADPRPQAASFRPVRTPAGLTIFASDTEAMLDVFHSRMGYIYALDNLAVGPQQQSDSGQKDAADDDENAWTHNYYCRTRPGSTRQFYNPQQAAASARMQAQSFISNRLRQADWIRKRIELPAVITLSLKAEMFGQSWYEGTIWLEEVLRLLSREDSQISSAHFSELCSSCDLQVCTPNAGSSNRGSFNASWLNESSSWIYRHIYLAGNRMLKMAKLGHQNDEYKLRLINQAARELLAAQSSDWPTLITSGIYGRWARKTVKRHLVSFHKLFDDLREGKVDQDGLRKFEERCPIFANISYKDCFDTSERPTPAMPNSQPQHNTPTLSVDKEEVIAGIVQIQKVTRELAVLCQQALATDKDVSLDISAKACESVAIVEDLARRACDPNAMNRYLDTTTKLENIIKIIADTNDTQELLRLHSEAIDAVDAWADTVESLLKSIIAQAS